MIRQDPWKRNDMMCKEILKCVRLNPLHTVSDSLAHDCGFTYSSWNKEDVGVMYYQGKEAFRSDGRLCNIGKQTLLLCNGGILVQLRSLIKQPTDTEEF